MCAFLALGTTRGIYQHRKEKIRAAIFFLQEGRLSYIDKLSPTKKLISSLPIAVKLWLNKWVIDKPTILGENLTDGQFGLYFERQKTYLHQDLDIVLIRNLVIVN